MYLEPTGERHAPAVETAPPGVIGIAAPPGVAIDLAGLLG